MSIEFDNVVRDLDYYKREPSLSTPTFQGKGARMLGIEGQFDDTQFRRLFQGQHPATGERLPGVRMVKNRRGAWDITFNRDKATSVLKHVAGDPRIAAVEERAERKAMEELERQVRVRVRKQSEIEKSKERMPKGWKHPERKSSNLIWVKFSHPASREGDPHSHSHYVVMAATHDATEGQWKSPEFGFVDRKAISHVHHAELAKGLRRLGYKARWDGKTFNVKGVPEEVTAEFSKRHHAIKAREAEFDKRAIEAGNQPMASKSRQKLGLHDRPEKSWEPYDQRRRGWLSRLTDSQRRGLRSLVARARDAVAQRHWFEGLRQHASKLRQFTITPDEGREREKSHGRSR